MEHNYFPHFSLSMVIISQYFHIGSQAIAGVDFDIPGLNFTDDRFLTVSYNVSYNFTISPGETRCIEVIIIDDNVAGYRYKQFYYYIGVYNPDRGYCDSGYIYIEDNEGKLVYYSDIFTRHFDGLRINCVSSPFYICSILIPPGLRFEQLEPTVTVHEDVGSVELCVSYRGDNVPPSIDATIRKENFGKQNKIHYCCNVMSSFCVH